MSHETLTYTEEEADTFAAADGLCGKGYRLSWVVHRHTALSRIEKRSCCH